MKDWECTLLPLTATLHQAIRTLDESAAQICLVTDEHRHLLGTVTDGDIRRGLLRALDLNAPVSKVMNSSPRSTPPDRPREILLELMNSQALRHLPIVDSEGHVIGLVLRDELIQSRLERPNRVFLLAGGLGTRLRPLTEDIPKPLLKVGGKPILETILESFLEYGFRRFYFSINYLGEKIREHFGDGQRWGARIDYLEEDEPRGTAGPLSMISDTLDSPLIVMNGDLLTRINYEQLLVYHDEQGTDATICVREYDFQVPFGVVSVKDQRLYGISEKPVHRFFVNAGIYVLDQRLIKLVPQYGVFDMPDLLQSIKTKGGEVSVFPIREYWLDIGRIEEFEKANKDFDNEFQ